MDSSSKYPRSALYFLCFVEVLSLLLGCRTTTSLQELREDGLGLESFQPEIELLQSQCFVQNHYFGDVNSLSWDAFKAKVLSGASGGIKGFENELKHHADFRTLLQSFVLIGNSNSLFAEAISPRHPRVIMFENGIIITRTGSENSVHRVADNSAEVIYLNPDTDSFEFKFIDFSTTPPSIDENPSSCSGCHVAQQPVWPSYRTWPGAYNDSSRWIIYNNPKGYENLERVTKEQANSFEGPGVYQYFYDRATKNNTRNKWGRGFYRNAKGDQFVPAENTTHFGLYLSEMNLQRLARRIRSIAMFDTLKPATLAALAGCANWDGFFDESGRQELRISSQRFMEFENDTRQAMTKIADEKEAKAHRYASPVPDPAGHYRVELQDVARAAALRMLFEPLGLDIAEYSTDYDPDVDAKGYGFHTSAAEDAGLGSLKCYLIPHMKQDTELMHVFFSDQPKAEKCESYGRLSQQKSRT